MQNTSIILLCARQEFLLAIRSRWTQIFATLFAALSLAVAGSGYILSGGSGVQDFARTAASLVQLVLLLVPLNALVVGVLALAPERGFSELLFSQPCSRRTVLLGRLFGLFAALTAAEAIGLGGAGLIVFSRSGGAGLAAYALLFVGSLVLTAVFLGIAAVLAAAAVGKRARALAVALLVWFSMVLLFDIAVLGLASLFRSGTASRVLIVSVLVNPVDAVRIGVLLALQGTTAFGSASLAFLRFTHGTGGAALLLGASALLWILAPAALAIRRLDRVDL